MRIIAFLFLCSVIACWRGEPLPETPRAEAPVRKDPRKANIQKSRSALVFVETKTLGTSGQTTTYRSYGLVVDRHHVLTGGLPLLAGEVISSVAVRSHGRFGQPSFEMTASIVDSLRHPHDQNFTLLRVVKTDEKLPVKPVIFSWRRAVLNQEVVMFTSIDTLAPLVPVPGKLQLFTMHTSTFLMVDPTTWSTHAVFNEQFDVVGYDHSLVPDIVRFLANANVRYRLSE